MQKPYTAGPWHADKKSDGITVYGPSGEWPISDLELGPTSEGDARLIAAAPELLQVAKRCLAMVSTDQGPPDWDWIRDVIRKAENG